MKKLLFFTFSISLIIACNTVPLTGRKQVKLIPNSEIQAMSAQQYSQVLQEAEVIQGTHQSKMIKEVGNKIKGAVEKYLSENGHAELIQDFDWEFNLLREDNTVNAWCMPGGKVAFYTGIMPVCQDENGVAVVMGHEVAHAIAQHGNERMSHAMLQEFGSVALSVMLSEKPEETRALFAQAYGIGSQLGVMLPFSRQHESEADKMGLIFMAIAGYDPQTAPVFWERMSRLSQGQQPDEFMSTHPSHETRVSNLNSWMPEAMKYYEETK